MRWLSLTFMLLIGCTATAPKPSPMLRVATYNIRYGTADDGENRWELRRDALVESIRALDADVIGTQETLAMQRDFLATALPHYGVVAAGRDDGREAGEMTAVLYRRDRFDLLAFGHFWLSPTPEKPGSMGWDAAITRMATWLRLGDRLDPGGRPIIVINTHFDHVGEAARLESARLIRRRAGELGSDCSIVLLGDFNCGEGDPPYKALLATDDDNDDGPRLIDAYRAANPMRTPREGTFHAFDASRDDGRRIDWIVVSDDLAVRAAAIDRSMPGGRLPSDHYAVWATISRRRR